MSQVATAIKRELARRGQSQGWLARELGLIPSSVHRMLRRETMTLENAEAMMEVLGLHVVRRRKR